MRLLLLVAGGLRQLATSIRPHLTHRDLAAHHDRTEPGVLR
jgi:hypothetical protein